MHFSKIIVHEQFFEKFVKLLKRLPKIIWRSHSLNWRHVHTLKSYNNKYLMDSSSPVFWKLEFKKFGQVLFSAFAFCFCCLFFFITTADKFVSVAGNSNVYMSLINFWKRKWEERNRNSRQFERWSFWRMYSRHMNCKWLCVQ